MLVRVIEHGAQRGVRFVVWRSGGQGQEGQHDQRGQDEWRGLAQARFGGGPLLHCIRKSWLQVAG